VVPKLPDPPLVVKHAPSSKVREFHFYPGFLVLRVHFETNLYMGASTTGLRPDCTRRPHDKSWRTNMDEFLSQG